MYVEFEINNTIYKYTNQKQDVDDYIAIPIFRSEINIEMDENNDVTLTMDYTYPPIADFRGVDPGENYWVRIYNDQKSLMFIGKISSVKFEYDNKLAKVKCISLANVFNSMLPYHTFSDLCPYLFGDRLCGVNQEDYRITPPPPHEIVSDNSIKIEHMYFTYLTTNFQYGYMICYYDDNTFKSINIRSISMTREQDDPLYETWVITTELSIVRPDANLLSIDLVPGCNKTLSGCYMYNNKENFGGFPFIPADNPTLKDF